MNAWLDMILLQWQARHPMHIVSMDAWILASMLFYAWVVQRNIRKIGGLCSRLFDFRDFGRNKSSERIKHSRRFWKFSFLALAIVNVSWLLYAAWMYSGWKLSFDDSHYIHMGCNYLLSICVAYTISYYLIKGLVEPIFAYVFDESRFGLFVWRMGLSYDFLLAVFAFPCLMVFLYTDGWVQTIVFWLVIALFALFLLLKVAKAVIMGRAYSRFSYLHIFVYVCALEILPALCLWQIVFGW